MANFTDVTLNLGKYRKMEEYVETNAFILAIRNILFTRPGNYPLTPSLGMDIEKHLFDIGNEDTANKIRIELRDQIGKYISNASNVNVDVQIIEDTNLNERGEPYLRNILGISVSALFNGESVSTNFLMYMENSILNVYNEIN